MSPWTRLLLSVVGVAVVVTLLASLFASTLAGARVGDRFRRGSRSLAVFAGVSALFGLLLLAIGGRVQWPASALWIGFAAALLLARQLIRSYAARHAPTRDLEQDDRPSR